MPFAISFATKVSKVHQGHRTKDIHAGFAAATLALSAT
jgi:hypothetical protein